MHVELIDSMGNDLRIVNAARLSTDKQHSELTEADKGLIKRLIVDEHGSPFEKVRFEFLVEVPVFIARQWFKHRFSSFNEISGRYTDYKPKFYLPEREFVRKNVGKKMDYTQEMVDIDVAESFIQEAAMYYEHFTRIDIAGEIARIFTPMGLYTKFMWGVDLRSLTNFLVLRDDPHAQLEIQKAAKKVDEAFRAVCPVTYDIWHELGRPRLAGIDG